MERADKKRQRRRAVLTACVTACLTASVATAAMVALAAAPPQQQAQAITPTSASCPHAWHDDLELVHHDALTREVAHGPETREEEALHTVCNICGETIDGATELHARTTGHAAYTTDVPLTETVIVAGAWTETVEDAPAYDELVATSQTCALCGRTKALPADA